MKAFYQWCAGSVIASIVLALLVCGSMMGMVASGEAQGASSVMMTCGDRACAPMPQGCLLDCLAGTDELEVRTLLSVGVLVVFTVAAVFVSSPQFSSEFVRISAPPWRLHRLFAFRE